MLTPFNRLFPAAIVTLHRDPAWRVSLDLLVARGWFPDDLLFAIHALDGIEDEAPTPTPHDVARCLLRTDDAREVLEGHRGPLNTWETRVRALVRSEEETRALLVVAAAFWDDDEVGHAIDAAHAA